MVLRFSEPQIAQPNGERLNLPNSVRIMFGVESLLRYATLATVSRCGMVWFSNDALMPFPPDALPKLSQHNSRDAP